jgi:hypothetical protein
MVLSRSVYFIEKFFLTGFVGVVGLDLTHWDCGLLLQILLEHLIVLSCQCFDCNSALLAEVVIGIFTERPLHKFF